MNVTALLSGNLRLTVSGAKSLPKRLGAVRVHAQAAGSSAADEKLMKDIIELAKKNGKTVTGSNLVRATNKTLSPFSKLMHSLPDRF